MNKKITALAVLLLIGLPFLIVSFSNTKTSESLTPSSVNNSDITNTALQYSDNIIIDQKDIQLNHEVIQYKIIFHDNDTINVSALMIVQQTGKDFEPRTCMLILTNGSVSIFNNKSVWMVSDIPAGLIIDITMFGHRIAAGGRLFHKLLNYTRLRIGSSQQLFKNANVKNGDVWYLTLANLNRKPEEALKISFRSVSSSLSMELVQLDRHSNMGFYSSLDNDFEGRYTGVKFPFLPYGFSIANNLHTEVVTTKGSILSFCSVGHTKGRMEINTPYNKTYVSTERRMLLFNYAGNQTGKWYFSASGIGFPWKHLVWLFYIDVDPYMKTTTF
jgi:hypothetical protein